MTLRLLIGSGNAGKIAQYREILSGLDVELVEPRELPEHAPEPDEDADTYAANAAAKARAYAAASGLTTAADDSGLEVDALGGAPGVRSRRYFGEGLTDAERNARLLELLEHTEDRAARFVCVVALVSPDGATELFEGEVRGEIAREPRGQHGFGYDPLFVIAGDGRTMAELAPDEKNALSHRGIAGTKLRARLAGEPR